MRSSKRRLYKGAHWVLDLGWATVHFEARWALGGWQAIAATVESGGVAMVGGLALA